MGNGEKSTSFRMKTQCGGVGGLLRAALGRGSSKSLCPEFLPHLAPPSQGQPAVTDRPTGLNRPAKLEPPGESGTYLPLIGLCSWQLSYKPQGQDHTHPRVELYQEAGTSVPLWARDRPQASQFGGLCGRSRSQLGPFPGSGPRYGLVAVRGLYGLPGDGWCQYMCTYTP